MMRDLFTESASGPILRPYQSDIIELLDAAVADGARTPLVVLPTGSGKTVIAAAIMRREIAAGGRPLFVVPRRELATQASLKLRDAGVEHGVIMAGADHLHDVNAPAQVASLDTLMARMVRRGMLSDLPGFTLVLIDEAHLAVTARRIELFDRWPNAVRIGLTATPIRKDGRALGVMFDRLVEGATIKTLTDGGHLVPARYFSLSEPDLARVRVTAGDYNHADLEEAVNQSRLVGDAVSTWLRHAADRRSVVFCISVRHSVAVAEAFQRAGVAAEHVDAGTPTAEREDTFARFTRGDTQVLTNCFLASYGFDLPALSCVVLARPTQSLMLYLQMIGRGLRPADGKSDCLVLDHSGAVHRFGFADRDWEWSLDGHHDLSGRNRAATRGDEPSRMLDCPECFAVFSGTTTCPECGHRITPRGQDVEALPGDLVEVGPRRAPSIDRARFFAELRTIAEENRYSPKWAAAQFRDRFGEWPPWAWNSRSKAEPTLNTRRWVKSRAIAFKEWRESARKATIV